MSRKANFKRAEEKKRRHKAEARSNSRRSERDAWEAGAETREAQNLERLLRDAVLLLVDDDQPIAGIVSSGSGWEFLVRNGLTDQESPFDDPVDAVLHLYAELALVKLRVHIRDEDQSNDICITKQDKLKILPRGAAAACLLEETRRVLNVEFDRGQLDDEVLEVFYEHFADESRRNAIQDIWAREQEAHE